MTDQPQPPADLDHLDRLHAAATPGPWASWIWDQGLTDYGAKMAGFVAARIDGPDGHKGAAPVPEDGYNYEPGSTEPAELRANYDLIAALRNAYPALRDEIRALREENARLIRELSVQKATANTIGSALDRIKAGPCERLGRLADALPVDPEADARCDRLMAEHQERERARRKLGGERYALIQDDGHIYLVPAERREEAREILDVIEDYWSLCPTKRPDECPAEPPEWMRTLGSSLCRLTFTDPQAEG